MMMMMMMVVAKRAAWAWEGWANVVLLQTSIVRSAITEHSNKLGTNYGGSYPSHIHGFVHALQEQAVCRS
jgi:hypothetical protein